MCTLIYQFGPSGMKLPFLCVPVPETQNKKPIVLFGTMGLYTR